MKIIIFGSMTTSKEMLQAKSELEKLGHQVTLPTFTEDYAKLVTHGEMHRESAQNKIDHDLIRKYYELIKEHDVCLTLNIERKSIPGYIGANSLIEIAFAHVLNKPNYLLNQIPEMDYKDELVAMRPIVINGDFTKIK
jgi:hypothetical protein